MDMSMMKGAPWLDQPVKLHSDRTYKCSLKIAEQCIYQQGYWRFWYEADHRYGLPTIGLFCAGIGLFTFFALVARFAPRSVVNSKPGRQLAALNRYLSYRMFRIEALKWNSAPLGLLLLGAVGLIYFLAMTLGPQPYYWPNTKTLSFGSSPPIATRSGFLSLACLPFVFATSSKSNFITAFTGVSHEKLQIFHRWISYAMYVTALVHTFPFIVYHVWKGDMVMQWNTSVVYWTGVVALLAQTWLTFASISPLRNMAYEFFKFSHFLAGVVFVVFFFIHCDFRLSSWDYFIATGVLFSLTFLYSQLRVLFEHGTKKATLAIESNGFISVSIPTQSTWTAGQHYFIRFFGLGIHAMGSHPFTICSLPQRGSFNDVKDSSLVFYIRPQGGLTARLARFVEQRPNATVSVSLDGPYGGCNMTKIAESDRLLAVAGGSGAGFLLPIIEAFLRRLELAALRGEFTPKPSLRVILATRDYATRNWFEEAVGNLIAVSSLSDEIKRELLIEVNFTGSETNLNAPKLTGQFLSKLEDPEKTAPDADVAAVSSGSDSDAASGSGISRRELVKNEVKEDDASARVHRLAHSSAKIADREARPDLPRIIEQEASEQRGRKMAVFLCGPTSMQKDVANAAARENLRLMKEGAGELYLHMEHFSLA